MPRGPLLSPVPRSDVLDKGPFSVANDHGAYRPPESHDDGKTPASDTTPQQHRVTGYPAVLSDAGLTSGPPASHREGPSRPPPICVTPHKRSAEVAPDATGASPPVDRRPHRADDQAAAPPSTVRRPKLGSSAFGATEDETWRADESEDDDLVEAADGVVTARVFSAPGDRERSEEMGRRARRGAAGRWGGRAGRVSETELLEEMRASSARRRKERVVCDGPTEEDLERQREKRGKRAKIGQEDCAALREVRGGECDGGEITGER